MSASPSTSRGSSSGEWDATVVKAADQSIASSIVLTNDSELFFAAVNGAQYLVELLIVYGSPVGGGTPDMNVGIGEDGTARGAFYVNCYDTSNVIALVAAVANQGNVAGFGTATTDRLATIRGTYTGGGGTFRFKWSQTTSGVNPTIVRAGSLLRYKRIV